MQSIRKTKTRMINSKHSVAGSCYSLCNTFKEKCAGITISMAEANKTFHFISFFRQPAFTEYLLAFGVQLVPLLCSDSRWCHLEEKMIKVLMKLNEGRSDFSTGRRMVEFGTADLIELIA
uniref:Uncharacterized protein n=1 Tax=Opuntia streptacantha TaxID=393608 RepID=A0A7C9E4Q5_OPUST